MTAQSMFLRVLVFGGGLVVGLAPGPSRADALPKEYRDGVARGLEFLAKNQARDGHWEGFGGQYPVTMTALSGMALLMEGSTLHEGKYQDNLRRTVDWLTAKSQPNGMLNNPNLPGENGRSMYGHGYALLFVACVYGEEEDGVRRRQLQGLLTRAALFSRDAQAKCGGWGYVPAREGNNFDEGSQTVIQVQALCAARDAGIAVPPDAVNDAIKYLKKVSNGSSGGVKYSLGGGCGGDRPPLTAAAVVCGFGTGDYNSDLIEQRLKFCGSNLGSISEQRMGVEEYTHYYFAQVVYALGDDGWATLFPDSPEDARLTWKKYRKQSFDYLIRNQRADGSWPGSSPGSIYATAVYCTIMQLDNGTLPIHQRRAVFAPAP